MKKKIKQLLIAYENLLEQLTQELKNLPPQPEGYHWVEEARLKESQKYCKMIIQDLEQLII